MLKSITVSIAIFTMSGCAFEFEVTSQRTALERQILGSYQEIEEDLVLTSSVRALDENGQKKEVSVSLLQQEALRAKQNQDFNRDDIDELKNQAILGESYNGYLAMVPESPAEPTAQQRHLAKILIREENSNRDIIWRRIIQINEELTPEDLPSVRQTYRQKIYEESPEHHWFEGPKGQWLTKEDASW
jgi:uncharacterized protein YdbL (DUF1318 family)